MTGKIQPKAWSLLVLIPGLWFMHSLGAPGWALIGVLLVAIEARTCAYNVELWVVRSK